MASMTTPIKIGRQLPAHFSGHETFPLRQMWLKKVYERALGTMLIRKSEFTDENAIASFGVGKNMVASIRHWALACGVMVEAGEDFRIRGLAAEILDDDGLDPYAENPSTAWLVHWQLAGCCIRSPDTFVMQQPLPLLMACAGCSRARTSGASLGQALLAGGKAHSQWRLQVHYTATGAYEPKHAKRFTSNPNPHLTRHFLSARDG